VSVSMFFSDDRIPFLDETRNPQSPVFSPNRILISLRRAVPVQGETERAWDLTSRPQTVKKMAASTSALSTMMIIAETDIINILIILLLCMMIIADEFPTTSSGAATVDAVENPTPSDWRVS